LKAPDGGDPVGFTQGAFRVERVDGEKSAFPNLVEVELVVENLPDFAGNAGESVVVRGHNVFTDDRSQPLEWSGDGVRGTIGADRSTRVVFYQDLATGGQARTDFKAFRDASWSAVLVDRTATSTTDEGNIRLDLLSIAGRGDKVRVTVDAADEQARAAVPSDVKGPAFIEYVEGARSDFPNLLEVELVLTNLPEKIGPRPLPPGDRVVVRGEFIYADGGSAPKKWDGDDVGGAVGANRSVRTKFYQRLAVVGEQRLANFKVFRESSWNEVVIDRNDPAGNLVLDLLAVGSVGSKVRVTIDASNASALPPPPEATDGPFTLRFDERKPGAHPGLVEVALRAVNLPAFAGKPGDRVVVRGKRIYTDATTARDWDGDQVAATVNADRSAETVFYLEPGVTDLKLFRELTWTPVAVDNGQSDGNVRLDLDPVSAPGSRVELVVDASQERALAPVPMLLKGAYRATFLDAGANTLCGDLIEVTLRASNLPAAAGAAGDKIVVRGDKVYTGPSSTTPSTWDGDGAAGVIDATRAAAVTFCQALDPAGQKEANFKVFKAGTWDEVLRDSTDLEGNIRLDLLPVAFPGSRVAIDVNAGDPRVAPSP
jgi:hypothetical protein